MLIARIIGGLGNQMFQYATARAVSLRSNIDLKLDLSDFDTYKLHDYGLNKFCLTESIAKKSNYVIDSSISKKDKLKKFLGLATSLKVFKESGLEFDSKILEVSENTYIDGYWQSEQYFSDFEEQIRQDFTFKFAPSDINQTSLELINSVCAVSIHIRRGDYVNNPTVNAIHGICDLNYYKNAIDYIYSQLGADNIHFFIFSDDPAWVKQNIQIDSKATFISHNDAKKNYEDLRLMSACKHHVIANSSFSWWGAWLNPNEDKIVIAPKHWFKSQSLNSNDIVPSTWIKM